jgi:hypothetical protein
LFKVVDEEIPDSQSAKMNVNGMGFWGRLLLKSGTEEKDAFQHWGERVKQFMDETRGKKQQKFVQCFTASPNKRTLDFHPDGSFPPPGRLEVRGYHRPEMDRVKVWAAKAR